MKQQGFVLMTIIIILTVLTSLVVANLRWVALDWKRYTDLHRFQEKVMHLEQIAEALGARLGNNALHGCILDNQNDAALQSTLLDKGCKFAQHYCYGISDLGVFPCVKLSPKLSTHHWLLTVIDEQLPNKWLQLRIATAEPYQPCHGSRAVYVQNGVLTRYWL
ncbi:MAG: hypothetical protein KBB94_06675 [Legionellaceae bacterium]|nr:hypothetical protein [Legionellaceae bacterium]MBP9775356.1 hypothetical protein [Legionellaceae bacterium]